LISKQVVVVVAAVAIALLGYLGVLAERPWLVGLSAFLVLVIVAAMVSDVHRKVGIAMAEIRAVGATGPAALIEIREEAASVGTSMGELRHTVNELGQRIDAIERARVSAVSELASLRSQLLTRFDLLNKDLSRGLETMAKEVDGTGTPDVANLSSLKDQLISQIDATLQIHHRLPTDGPVPLMGGWAMSPVGMKTLIDLASAPEVSLIVECGSGTSTIFLAMALERAGKSNARVVSLEHLDEYADLTRTQLQALGLDERVEVRVAPLEPVTIEAEDFLWYSKSSYQDLSGIDLLLVDGPPGATGPKARFPAYPVLKASLASRAVLILDDTVRRDERRIAETWLKAQTLSRLNGYPPGQYVFQHRSA
jgi:predicted O-methyltransferase YrrM